MRVAVQLQLSAAPSAESPVGTIIPPATQIVDAEGAVWTVGPDLHGRGPVPVRNGIDVSQGGWGCWTLTYAAGRKIRCYGGQGEIEWGTPAWGGDGEPPPPPPPPPPQENRNPVWDESPLFFAHKVAGTQDLARRASDPDGDPLTLRVLSGLKPALEGAFHLNQDRLELSYDGRDLGLDPDDPLATLELDTGIVLEADDGR